VKLPGLFDANVMPTRKRVCCVLGLLSDRPGAWRIVPCYSVITCAPLYTSSTA